MAQVLLSESLCLEHAQEEWPEDVKLFQPFEIEQILLPDNAACLSVQAFLKMCGLPYMIEMRGNAEHMSPTNRVPFIKAGAFVISELDPIISFVANKEITLTKELDSSQKADMRAYMSLVNNVLGSAELYVSWVDSKTYEEVTQPRYGSVYPWPLDRILTLMKKYQVTKKLKVLGWRQKTLEQVYEEVEHCCTALSERLGSQPYFFGSKPTELDALVFGHLFTLLTTPLPENKLATIVKSFPNLTQLCREVERHYFDRSPTHVSRHSSNGNDDYDKLEDIHQIPM